MKKITHLLTLAACLAQLAVRANDIEPGKETYTATKLSTPITLDGVIGADWAGVPVLSDPKFSTPKEPAGGPPAGNYVLFEQYNGGTWTGPDDQTSAVQVAWDADNVYFGFVVTDDYQENISGNAWNGDAVQLMIADASRTSQVALYDYALGGYEDDKTTPGTTTFVDTDSGGNPYGLLILHEARPAGAEDTDVKITRDTAKHRTYYEIKLPASALGLSAPLAAGTKFGLGMAINDGDGASVDGTDYGQGPTQQGQKGWGGLGAHSIVFGKTPAETALVTLGSDGPGTDIIFLSAINPTFNNFSFRATDKGTSIVDPATGKLTVDGQTVTLTHTPKQVDATDFSYTPTSPFPSGTSHTYTIELKDTAGHLVTTSGSFVTPQYALLAAADKVTADTSKPGFIWRVHQNNAFTANDNYRPLVQLAGWLGENLADPAAQGPALAPGTPEANSKLPIDFEVETVINFDQAGADAGEINPTDQMPGIPGTTGGMDGIAGEITTYLDLTAGTHTLIVNSDDGFRTTAGNINDVFKAQVAGEFSGGRGAADTAYTVFVQDPGVYAFRTVYQEGGGGANIEWKEVLPDGTTHVLINDAASGSLIKAYRSATGGPLAKTSIKAIGPVPNSTGNVGDTAINVLLLEGSDAVDLNSVKLSLNGSVVSATPIKTGNQITLKFQPPSLLPSASSNNVSLTYSAGGVSRTENWHFLVGNYVLLTSDLKVTPDTTKPGFIWKVHQNNAFTATDNDRAVKQLAGLLGPNLADPTAQGAAIPPATAPAEPNLPLTFEIETVINLDQTGADNGEFNPNDQMPGIPGTGDAGQTDGIAAEINTYVELPAGKNTFIVNSDDGFRTTAGVLGDVFKSPILGEFNGGRGAADTAYDFFVETAGVYCFRTVYEEGGGGANIEWKYVKPDGSHVLINDVANGGPKAYRALSGTGPTDPKITSVSPIVNYAKAQPGTSVQVAIQENTVQVDAGASISVDGGALTTTLTRSGSVVTLKAQPGAALSIGSHTAKVTFTAGGKTRTEQWSFTVPPSTLDKIHSYVGLILGSAVITPDKGGHTGAAGDKALDLGPPGGNIPSVLIPDASFLNATAADNAMTFSLWIKKYDNADSSAFWADSPSSSSGQRGFQAHTPWSNNNIYFDTAGCCGGSETRINADMGAFNPDFDWNTWHHYVFTKEGDHKVIWIDGAIFLEGDNTFPLPTDFTEIWLGAEGGGPDTGTTHNMHGLIDDFAVFGTALAQADITKIFTGTDPSTLAATTKPLALWTFDGGGNVGGDKPVLTISRNADDSIKINWINGGTLYVADKVDGPYTSTGDSSGSRTVPAPAAGVGAKFWKVIK